MNLLFISLGCDKNLVDTEKMLGILGKEGYSFVDDENEADIVVVNTCCFIGDAKEESINTILQMAELKKTGRLKALIVTGCLAQRYKQEIIDEIPEVDAILGTTSYEAVGEVIKEVMHGETPEVFESIDAPVSKTTDRLVTTGGHYAFLKIAEGCDKRCTYCIIPYLRGKYRSVPMEQLVKEAEVYCPHCTPEHRKMAVELVEEVLSMSEAQRSRFLDFLRLSKRANALGLDVDVDKSTKLYFIKDVATNTVIAPPPMNLAPVAAWLDDYEKEADEEDIAT